MAVTQPAQVSRRLSFASFARCIAWRSISFWENMEMTPSETRSLRGRSLLNTRFAVALLATTALGGTFAHAGDDVITFFAPGHLLVSRSVYNSPASIITPGQTVLPPNCTLAPNCVTATAD